MKLILLLTIVLGIQINASVYSQTKLLSLKVKEAPIREVLSQLEESSKFKFFYNEDFINVDMPVSIKVSDNKIDEILEKVLEDTDIDYQVLDNNMIVLTKRKTTQEITIKGKVTDIDGKSLPGVNVVEKGTTNGAVTNLDGNYSISVNSPDAVLSFSFIGFLTEEINVSGQTILDVVLIEDIQSLEEVVIIGYGSQKRINLTGSVESIKGEEISKRQVGQASMALQGMAAGVTVTQSSGQPGRDGGAIRIRGIGTINTSSAYPLVLVDGIESSINNVDPNDIESISVLKDAASAAIYGSRAANGVILITTKRADKGKFSINYNSYVGWQEATDLPDMVSGYDHMVMINEANKNVDKPEPFSQEYINAYLQNAPSDDYPETDWHEVMLKDRALQQNHHLSVTGGGEKVNILGAISYFNQDGLSINTNYKRVALRLNSDIHLHDNLTMGFDMSLREDDDAEPAAGQPWAFMNRQPQNIPGKNEDGSWGLGWDGWNEWATETNGGMKHDKGYEAILNMKFDWQPFDGLNINFQYAPKRSFAHFKQFTKHVDVYYPNGEIYNFSEFKAELVEKLTKNTTNNLKGLVTYSRAFGKHDIKALVGYEQTDFRNEWIQGTRIEYPLENYEVLDAGSPESPLAEGDAYDWALRSYFGRINYNIDQKYLFEANIRYDGSSRFAEGNRYGIFPSFSAGWRISEESFLTNIGWLDNLKLRASWGRLGNQNIGGYYPFASVVTLGKDYVFNNVTPVQGAAILDAANPNISWETTEMTNFAVDATLSSNLNFTFEYYIKNTFDILLKLPTPMVSGLNSPYQNAGKMKNTGWELSLGYADKVGDFEYQVAMNLSDVKNEIIDLVGTGPYISTRSIKQEGKSIYSLYGLEAIGLFQDEDEIANHATQYGAVHPGDIKYKDQLTVDSDGDGIPDQADGQINSEDRVIIGEYMPKYTYGINLYAKYKNIDFSALIQGVGKIDGYIDGQGVYAFYVGGTAQEWHKDYWTPDNPGASYPRLTFNYPNNEQVSSYWMKSAAYLRLKNLQFGYNIPNSVLNKTFLKSCRIYFSGQNLLTLDNFYESFDPEAPIGNGNFYPMVKVYSFGIDVKF